MLILYYFLIRALVPKPTLRAHHRVCGASSDGREMGAYQTVKIVVIGDL